LFFHGFLMVFHGFFKELDFTELEIHRYSLLDTINEYQWTSINEFIDGPSMNMVSFFGHLSLVPFFWAPFFGWVQVDRVDCALIFCPEWDPVFHGSLGSMDPQVPMNS